MVRGAVEGIGDGEKVSWEERGQLTLTPPPHSAQGHKGAWLLVRGCSGLTPHDAGRLIGGSDMASRSKFFMV